ncbi:MAG TPA: hypothetical protein PLF78_03235 [Caulobacter sp.]|nr:hypothetical protein [Caulobacter sp.]
MWTWKRPICAAAVGLVLGGGALLAGDAARAEATAPAAGAYEVGRSYFGANGYIEYIPGDAPVILTAPHGGTLRPDSIPDRTKDACGGAATVVMDTNTAELVLAMRKSFHDRYGTYPHVIISRISRRKLDANRPLEEAACGNAEAARAFAEWHAFIDAAKSDVIRTSGRGWYMDMHGHGHDIQRLELGYLLKPALLNASDAELDASTAARERTGVRGMLREKSLSEILRGRSSLGALYARAGFRSVPSDVDPRPGEAKYFNGGYNTVRHTCGAEAAAAGGTTGDAICGIQIESNFKGVRDTPASRKRFGDATAQVLGEYLGAHWGLHLTAEAAKVRARG